MKIFNLLCYSTLLQKFFNALKSFKVTSKSKSSKIKGSEKKRQSIAIQISSITSSLPAAQNTLVGVHRPDRRQAPLSPGEGSHNCDIARQQPPAF